ncbi:hypothetical protein SRABI118_04224 [Massilia sp. Bi118]|uniref:hypothetical protein n=1 Tax=Massilia sp. Bi118 TaxID=2822346 RepID=UPI001DF18C40|nr:hypothetical protein [Massilia sp. Bi118]CAH0295916.1 hypothetical protein SRABI118_04224 [Massilia sp. Bi118]
MRVRNAISLVPFVLGTLACAAAHAQTDPPKTQFSIGAKIWHASWLSYVPATYTGIDANGGPALGDSVNGADGTGDTSVLPLLGVRHGKFFGSVSYGNYSSDFHVLSSSIILPNGQNLITSRTDHFKRRESDLNVGYYLTPEIGIALGYKDATESRDTTLAVAPQSTPLLSTKAKTLLLGAVGSFAVYEKLRFYFQAAYGPARLKLRFADPALSNFSTNGSYLIGELGLSYPIFTKASGYGGATASLGYRTQTVKTDSYAKFQEGRELRDVRDGAILALVFTL